MEKQRRGWWAITWRAAGTALLCLALSIGHVSPALADDDDDDDQESIRRSVERGEIKSLAELRRIVLFRVPGKIVSTDVDRDDDEVIYEFRVLGNDNRMVEVEIDAATGQILDIEND